MFPNFRHPIIKLRNWPVLLAALITTGALVAAEEATNSSGTADLVRKAEAALRVKPPSVTHKSKPAPSGNPNDYASTAPYFWPDPAKLDGLPYIRREGEVNPESRTAATDHERAQQMNSTVASLVRAHEATNEEKYAARAALCLRTWFLSAISIGSERTRASSIHRQSGRTSVESQLKSR